MKYSAEILLRVRASKIIFTKSGFLISKYVPLIWFYLWQIIKENETYACISETEYSASTMVSRTIVKILMLRLS
jgi:hypothetical protein